MGIQSCSRKAGLELVGKGRNVYASCVSSRWPHWRRRSATGLWVSATLDHLATSGPILEAGRPQGASRGRPEAGRGVKSRLPGAVEGGGGLLCGRHTWRGRLLGRAVVCDAVGCGRAGRQVPSPPDQLRPTADPTGGHITTDSRPSADCRSEPDEMSSRAGGVDPAMAALLVAARRCSGSSEILNGEGGSNRVSHLLSWCCWISLMLMGMMTFAWWVIGGLDHQWCCGRNRVVSNLGLTRSFQTGGARGAESSATSNRHSSDSRQVPGWSPPKLFAKSWDSRHWYPRDGRPSRRKKLRKCFRWSFPDERAGRSRWWWRSRREGSARPASTEGRAPLTSWLRWGWWGRGLTIRMWRKSILRGGLFVAQSLAGGNDHAGGLCHHAGMVNLWIAHQLPSWRKEEVILGHFECNLKDAGQSPLQETNNECDMIEWQYSQRDRPD